MMNKKILSIGFGVIIGLLLFTFVMTIKNSFAGANTQKISNFKSGFVKNRTGINQTEIINNEILEKLSEQLGISTGQVKTQIDKGKTIKEIIQENGLSMTGILGFDGKTRSGMIFSGNNGFKGNFMSGGNVRHKNGSNNGFKRQN